MAVAQVGIVRMFRGMRAQDLVVLGFVLALVSSGLLVPVLAVEWWRVMLGGLSAFAAALSFGCVRLISK
jgi:hypothetical protein